MRSWDRALHIAVHLRVTQCVTNMQMVRLSASRHKRAVVQESKKGPKQRSNVGPPKQAKNTTEWQAAEQAYTSHTEKKPTRATHTTNYTLVHANSRISDNLRFCPLPGPVRLDATPETFCIA